MVHGGVFKLLCHITCSSIKSKGSDFPGRWYTFEWDVEFPYDGEYKFIAQCDNDARFFLDNQAVLILK